MKPGKKTTRRKQKAAPRTHRKSLLFNNTEITVITGFCKKYKITNQSKFFRETIISAILRKSEEDHPKLF
jgi:hypothetical protein